MWRRNDRLGRCIRRGWHARLDRLADDELFLPAIHSPVSGPDCNSRLHFPSSRRYLYSGCLEEERGMTKGLFHTNHLAHRCT